MKVGNYDLGKTVGRGAFSKVKVATHCDTGQEYVLKIIDKKAGQPASPKRRTVEQEVKIEISIMKLLNHENIVQMYEVMESSKHFYIVLESVRGGDLCDHIMDAGKLTEKNASAYIHDLVNGLNACHQAGVAHRDIKPENCLISSAGVLKVADFGLSRLHRGRGDILDQSEMSTDSVGTLSYAAPEVLNGRYNAFRADLWSVGVVIFVACTGKFPFGSRGYTEAMVQEDIKNARVNKMPSHLTEEVRNLIMSLIVVDPEKRLTLAEMLKHPWLVPAVRPAEADGEDGSHTARKRPVPIDINAVTSKASEQVTDAVSDTMSPTWANSPMGNHPQKFVPPMFSPRSSSPRTSEALPKKPSTSVNSLVALKGMLEEEGKKLSQRSC